mgnify:CR=1 FL=1
MSKVKLGDMSHEDKKEYQYYKRVLQDFYIYGSVSLNAIAKRKVREIENKYAGSEPNAKN